MVSVNQPYTTQKGNSSQREQIPLKGVCATIAPAGDAGSQNECGCAFQFTLLKFTPFKVITIEPKILKQSSKHFTYHISVKLENAKIEG